MQVIPEVLGDVQLSCEGSSPLSRRTMTVLLKEQVVCLVAYVYLFTYYSLFTLSHLLEKTQLS